MSVSNQSVLAIDVGGTFADATLLDSQGGISHTKLPKEWLTEERKSIQNLLGDEKEYTLHYSTSLTLNRFLEGKLPRVALIVNKGFHSFMETARLPNEVAKGSKTSLVPLEYVQEIRGRIDHRGQEAEKLHPEEISEVIEKICKQNVDVVVIALLNSSIEPKHELAVLHQIKSQELGIPIIPSSQIVSERSEYERTLAAIISGCLTIFFKQDVDGLIKNLPHPPSKTFVVRSNGGIAKMSEDPQIPIETLLSGPAAAATRARIIAQKINLQNAISLDIGGTSTDLSLITSGVLDISNEITIANFPVRINAVNVQSVGSGGGSIAKRAPSDRWLIGPESAGANPGPACYGRGGESPTLTDAHLYLGRLPLKLAEGKVVLNPEKSKSALEDFGAGREYSVEKTARSILKIANNDMCGAIRQLTAQRTIAIEDYKLIGIGGAGPLHAAEIASLVGIRTVVVPQHPGTASALGALEANILKDFVSPFPSEKISDSEVDSIFSSMEQTAEDWLTKQDAPLVEAALIRKIDLRYKGMRHKSTIVCPANPDKGKLLLETTHCFHQDFEKRTGQNWKEREQVEIINLRVSLVGKVLKSIHESGYPMQTDTLSNNQFREICFLGHEKRIKSKVIQRFSLNTGDSFEAPCVIEEPDSTTLVPPGWSVYVDNFLNLILENE